MPPWGGIYCVGRGVREMRRGKYVISGGFRVVRFLIFFLLLLLLRTHHPPWLRGGVVLVSHDFRLIDQVADQIWVCENNTVRAEVHRLTVFVYSVPVCVLVCQGGGAEV